MSDEATTKKSGKMGGLSTLCVATGCIIGAGVFASLPLGVAYTGPWVEWGFVLAALTLIMLGIPTVVLTSALPGKNPGYLQLTRLVHPVVGFQQVTLIINMVILLAMLSKVFTFFVQPYFPWDADDTITPTLLAVGVLVLFAAVTSFGVAASSTVQNVMVILLVIALGLFIVLGFPHIQASNVTFGDVIAPSGFSLSGLGVTVVGLTSALIGGTTAVLAADKVRKPRRDIPLSFIGSTLICMVLFMLVAYVLLGTIDASTIDPSNPPYLQTVAQTFMGSGTYLFFCIAGGLFAVCTTINAVFLVITSGLSAVSDDEVLPSFLSKKNRFGIEVWTIWVAAVLAVILIVSGAGLDALMSAFGVANMLLFGFVVIPLFIVPKKYPNNYSRAFMRMNKPTMIVVSALAIILAAWQIWSVVSETPTVVLVLLAAYAACYLYFFLWYLYKKSKGVDIIAKMKVIPAHWTAAEEGGPINDDWQG